MSDSENYIDDDLNDLDNLIDEANGGADIEEIDDLELGDDQDLLEEAAAPETADDIAKQERNWIIITITAFTLALLTSLVLMPMVVSQQQRAGQVTEVENYLELNAVEATQALTKAGEYGPFESSLANTQRVVKSLIDPSSTYANLASKLFASGSNSDQVVSSWEAYQQSAEDFANTRSEVKAVKDKLGGLTQRINSAVSESVGFVDAVAREGRNKSSSSAKDRYLFLTSEASDLNGILGRLSSTVDDYYNENENLASLSNKQNLLSIQLQDTVNRILSNSATVVTTAAEPVQAQYKDLSNRIADISDSVPTLTKARTAIANMKSQGATLSEALASSSNQSALLKFLSQWGNLLPILFAVLGAYGLWRFFKLQSRDLVAQEANLSETLADQQESILKLLDEMSALADGDLTVEAEVTDQITGAIADSVNFAVIEMRELVSQINRASLEVANESELAVNSAQSVSQSNMQQAEQISSAAKLMQKVSESMSKMSQQAKSSSEMASESLQAANQGAEAVRDTISGMEDMREQIQDTSKRIKRLGESSQRIGDIVALIDDIAEQTNILSLNAAIQASMAGEAGRGFAVVSDEVQSLAERSTEATKKIAELVNTIQNDTNDAVLSMEKATQQVVAGTKVADSAGSALSAIEDASKSLSELVEEISEGSGNQAKVVNDVTKQVTQVSSSSTETSQKAQDSANSIAKLLELAKELEASVSRFKLPAS